VVERFVGRKTVSGHSEDLLIDSNARRGDKWEYYEKTNKITK
jgi:hypothetical protein